MNNKFLTACVVCKNERGFQLAKLLSNKFHYVYLIATFDEYYCWEAGIEEGKRDEISSSVDVIFIHQTDAKLLNNINIEITTKNIFKFTTSGEPNIQENELPIYRQVSHNNLNITLADIEEIIAYINKERSQLPSICYRNENINEWESQIQNKEYYDIQQKNEILNNLFSNLSNSQPTTPEYGKLYSFLGSPQPIIYILDDYNNYIIQENGRFQVSESNINNIAKYYREQEHPNKEHFIKVLQGLCTVLNNLSFSFTVKTYPLNLPVIENDTNIEQIQPTYQLIHQTLNLEQILNHDSDQIAAFIIDLEWLPNLTNEQTQQQPDEKWWQKWKQMGVKAIDILSQRYPEIPCFIFTGSHPTNEIQEALVHRAYWGFQKLESHHYHSHKVTTTENISNVSNPNIEYLNCITLENHLNKVVHRVYGSYQEVPFSQLNVNQNSNLWQILINKLKLKLPLETSNQGRAFTKLIAGLFPTAQQVELMKILSGGKSQAQATFLVSPISQNDRLATRFIKIGAWFLIQKEYLAYQKVIQPRLNSYTANIIQKPILTEVEQNKMPWGALIYTLAGFPEDYQNLQSLNEVFNNYKHLPDGANFLVKCVRDTLEKVLFPLYQSSISKLSKKQPLLSWLGEFLPFFYSGILIPLIKIPQIEYLDKNDENTKNSDIFIFPSAINDDIPKEEALKIGFSDLQQLNTQLKQQNQKVLLSGWKLISVDVPDNENKGTIIVVHPILGIRVYLRGCAEDIRLRFGATWIRPGMQVNVLVELDNQEEKLNHTYANLSRFGKLDNDDNSGVDLKIIQNFKEVNKISTLEIPSPIDIFRSQVCEPKNYTSFLGYAAPIHGDLNLNNILYAANETVGWLIDFERVKEQGLVAYDLAKLEGEIWIHHLLPYLKELASLSPAQLVKNCYQLLYFCLQSSEFSGDEGEFLKTKVRSEEQFNFVSELLLTPITNLLKVIKSIREFGFSKCKITKEELKWSLSTYFLNTARLHFPPEKSDQNNYIKVLAFLASAWHLIDIVPVS
jgi:hypothetical protein